MFKSSPFHPYLMMTIPKRTNGSGVVTTLFFSFSSISYSNT